MPSPTKRELEDDNRSLREALEELYDRVGELLGLDADHEDDQDANG